MPPPVALRNGDWAVSIGTAANAVRSVAPIAAGPGLILVRVPASATTITAPMAWTIQAAPFIRLNSETEASMTARAAAIVSR